MSEIAAIGWLCVLRSNLKRRADRIGSLLNRFVWVCLFVQGTGVETDEGGGRIRDEQFLNSERHEIAVGVRPWSSAHRQRASAFELLLEIWRSSCVRSAGEEDAIVIDRCGEHYEKGATIVLDFATPISRSIEILINCWI